VPSRLVGEELARVFVALAHDEQTDGSQDEHDVLRAISAAGRNPPREDEHQGNAQEYQGEVLDEEAAKGFEEFHAEKRKGELDSSKQLGCVYFIDGGKGSRAELAVDANGVA
jgi:hypothetical protein